MLSFTIKPLRSEYDAFMWELLYQAIFVAREHELADRDLDDLPTLRKYMEEFGSKQGDLGFVAIDQNNQPLGVAWVRLFTRADEMWGYCADDIPELNIAAIKSARGQGVGTALLNAMFKALDGRFDNVSLSVNPKNRCMSLYLRNGFKVVKTYEHAVTMLKAL